MDLGRRALYAIAAILIISIGLLTRLPLLPVPWGIAKPLGSVLWGAMVYCLVRTCRPRTRLLPAAAVAAVIAAGVEFSQLWHIEVLDAFRRTRIGVLLIGRFFSWGDIAAYTLGIGVACLVELAVYARRMR
jgi:MFS superfamily sulfate permease-like transporter